MHFKNKLSWSVDCEIIMFLGVARVKKGAVKYDVPYSHQLHSKVLIHRPRGILPKQPTQFDNYVSGA